MSAVKLINCWPGFQVDLAGQERGADAVTVQVLAACARALSMLELFVERVALALSADEQLRATVIVVVESLKASCRLLILCQPHRQALTGAGDGSSAATEDGQADVLLLLNWGNTMQSSGATRQVSSLASYRGFHRENLQRECAAVAVTGRVLGGGGGGNNGGTIDSSTYVGRRSGVLLQSPPPPAHAHSHSTAAGARTPSPTATDATSPEDRHAASASAAAEPASSEDEEDEFRDILVSPPPQRQARVSRRLLNSSCSPEDQQRSAVQALSLPEQQLLLAEVLYVLRPVVYAGCLRVFCTAPASGSGSGSGAAPAPVSESRRQVALLLSVAAELVVEALSVRLTQHALELIREQLRAEAQREAGRGPPRSTAGARGHYSGREFPAVGSSGGVGQGYGRGSSQALHEVDSELRRRKLMLLWYMVKAPVFGAATAPLLRLVGRSVTFLPGINQLPDALLKTLTWANGLHFMTAHS